jgi:heat shock protein HslJ
MKKYFLFLSCSILVMSISFNASARKKKTPKPADTVIAANSAISDSLSSASKEQLDGEWTIYSLRNKKVSTRERAYIYFDVKANRFYGNNGCNVINGDFSCPTAGSITMTNIISSLMSCHNATSERTVMKAINETSNFKITENNGIHYLSLLNSKGNVLLSLRDQYLNFLDGAWTVKEIEGDSVSDENIRLVIDISEMKLHGNSGCNIINGSIYLDPEKDWAIQFQQIISTRKMCPNINTETALLIALEETETCKKISNDEVALLDASGKTSAILIRLRLRK